MEAKSGFDFIHWVAARRDGRACATSAQVAAHRRQA